MPSKVFISYRRDDCKWAASTIHNALCETLSAENVFMDLDSISPGASWTEALSIALDQCEVTFVLIGESWLDARQRASGPPGRYNHAPDIQIGCEQTGAAARASP